MDAPPARRRLGFGFWSTVVVVLITTAWLATGLLLSDTSGNCSPGSGTCGIGPIPLGEGVLSYAFILFWYGVVYWTVKLIRRFLARDRLLREQNQLLAEQNRLLAELGASRPEPQEPLNQA